MGHIFGIQYMIKKYWKLCRNVLLTDIPESLRKGSKLEYCNLHTYLWWCLTLLSGKLSSWRRNGLRFRDRKRARSRWTRLGVRSCLRHSSWFAEIQKQSILEAILGNLKRPEQTSCHNFRCMDLPADCSVLAQSRPSCPDCCWRCCSRLRSSPRCRRSLVALQWKK